MKKIFAIVTVSLFLSAMCAPVVTLSAQEPQKKECTKSEKKECCKDAKKDGDKKACSEADKKACCDAKKKEAEKKTDAKKK